MSQFIIAPFPEERTLLSGGVEVGLTNALLWINGGTHTFTLSDPQNYEPAELQVTVVNTAANQPLEIVFTLPSTGARPTGPGGAR